MINILVKELKGKSVVKELTTMQTASDQYIFYFHIADANTTLELGVFFILIPQLISTRAGSRHTVTHSTIQT